VWTRENETNDWSLYHCRSTMAFELACSNTDIKEGMRVLNPFAESKYSGGNSMPVAG
jgi:hypothetical protein